MHIEERRQRYNQAVTRHVVGVIKSEITQFMKGLGINTSCTSPIAEQIATAIHTHRLMPDGNNAIHDPTKLEAIGKVIAQELTDTALLSALLEVNAVEALLNDKLVTLRAQQEEINLTAVKLKRLSQEISTGNYKAPPHQRLWRGADVIITLDRRASDQLAWSHQDDCQIVTGCSALAKRLSKLFGEVGKIMRPFLNYLSKYEFYGEMAQKVMTGIDSNASEPEILLAAVDYANAVRERASASLTDSLQQQIERYEHILAAMI